MSDRARTALLLLKGLGPSNSFWLARLAGCTEREMTRALMGLEREGLAVADDGRWRLTAAGRAACRVQHLGRPATIIRYRPMKLARRT